MLALASKKQFTSFCYEQFLCSSFFGRFAASSSFTFCAFLRSTSSFFRSFFLSSQGKFLLNVYA